MAPSITGLSPLAARLLSTPPGAWSPVAGPPPGVSRRPDTVSLSSAARELAGLQQALADASRTIVGADGRAAQSQAVLDGVARGLNALAESSDSRSRFPYRVDVVSPDVTFASVLLDKPVGDEPLFLDVDVTQSSQRAGLAINVPGGLLDLDVGSAFTLTIAGQNNGVAISLASGQTIGQLRNAINALGNVAGVFAEDDGTGSGLVLRSRDFGADAFVAVSSISGTGNIRVGQLLSDNANEPDRATFQTLRRFDRITDNGQDVQGTINGEPTFGSKNTLWIKREGVRIDLQLTTGQALDPGGANAQTLGSFRAAIVEQTLPPMLR